MDLTRASAYHGPGWRPREASQAEETRRLGWGSNSEYRRLKAVVLCVPGRELETIADPDRIQHLARVHYEQLERNFADLRAVYRKYGVEILEISEMFPKASQHYNLMYARDAFFATPEGAVIARMASEVRAGEEKFSTAALAVRSVPIRMSVGGDGFFEGADALWVNPSTVICGVGRRTNRQGAEQLEQVLSTMGVRVATFAVPPSIQHLLGMVQIVDKDLAFVRQEKAPVALSAFLREQGLRVVEIAESDEVSSRQAFNVVTLAPRMILMPAGNERTKKIFLDQGIETVEEIDISEILKGAGGIACATGILAREQE
jgi:N-dimethylarginine dimethylaminohydrolase